MDIQAQATLFRTTVMKLHQQVDKFKLPEGVNESALGALSVFSEQLKGFTQSISQYQISKVAPNVSGDMKAAVSVLDGKFRTLEGVMVATNALAEQTKGEVDKFQEELRTIADKLEAEVAPVPEEKVKLEARKARLETDSVEKKKQIGLCEKEGLLLKEVTCQLQTLERTINPNQIDRQSSEVREGKPKWVGVRWNKNRGIVAAIVFRDFALSPLRLTVSLIRMMGTFARSTWANIAYTVSSPSTFRCVAGLFLVGMCSMAVFGVGAVMAVGRGVYRTGVNFLAILGLPWRAGQSNWVRQVGKEQEPQPAVTQVFKGILGGITPSFGHVVTGTGDELTSCTEGEDEWIDDYWSKWDSWIENVVSQLGPPSDELRRQNLTGGYPHN